MTSLPQAPGQSFSSSFVLGPNGEIIGNSIYVDSDGKKVVNGINVEETTGAAQSPAILSRPDWDSSSNNQISKPVWFKR